MDFSTNIITASGEAFYTGLGISSGCGDKPIGNKVILDIGGASTELIKIQVNPFEIISSVSLAIGSVRATDWLKNDSFKLGLEKVLNNIKNYEIDDLICVAGTMNGRDVKRFKKL